MNKVDTTKLVELRNKIDKLNSYRKQFDDEPLTTIVYHKNKTISVEPDYGTAEFTEFVECKKSAEMIAKLLRFNFSEEV